MKNLYNFIQEKLRINKDTDIHDDYVDLKLPSGIFWNKYNYGANTEEEFGNYYNFIDAQNLTYKGIKLPTKKDFEELKEYCDHKWTEVNGINGMMFISKKNDKHIFLPAAGNYYENKLYFCKDSGYYWSSTSFSNNDKYGFNFNKSSIELVDYYKLYQFSIRPILYK